MTALQRPAENAAASIHADWRCAYWCALLALGFAYVAMILCHRSTPFASGDNQWNDWLGVMLSGPTLFLLSTRHTLRPFGEQPVTAVLWNVAGFGLLFFAALHWEYVGQLTGASFSLTSRHLTHLNTASKIAVAVGLVIAVSVITICLREAFRARILVSYLASFAALIGTLVAITVMLGPRYHVHIHHYFFSLALLPFVRFRQPVCFITQAILAGVYVEGATRWGLSPIWYGPS
ncbi:MAG: hypothetical protein WCK27_23145 [Verrucomicrobiota bacterium]